MARTAERIAVPTSAHPRVSIMVPSAAGADLLEACLRSLARHAPRDIAFEVIVLLNVDVERTWAMLCGRVTGVRVIRSAVNLGLAGAGNRCRAAARGELLVLLHDDAEIEPGWLEALVETADRHPEAGAIGGQILHLDGSLQNAGMILWCDGMTSPPWIGAPPPPSAFDRLRAVDYVATASLLVRAATWDAVGGLDEAFFPAYYVDVDLSLAIRAHGQVTLYQPGSRIRHHKSASTGIRFRTFVSARNRQRLLAKWERALVEHEPCVQGSAEAIARALARAEAAAMALYDRGRPSPATAGGPGTFDVAAQETRHVQMDTALQREYAAWLEAALVGAEAERDRLRNDLAAATGAAAIQTASVVPADELADLRARAAILGALERGPWWSWYLRLSPLVRTFRKDARRSG